MARSRTPDGTVMPATHPGAPPAVPYQHSAGPELPVGPGHRGRAETQRTGQATHGGQPFARSEGMVPQTRFDAGHDLPCRVAGGGVTYGAPASRLLGALADGVATCVTVTLVDGLVLARSALHHSMNHRSVIAFGKARPVVGEGEKARALALILDHLAAGRAGEVRPPSRAELVATAVIGFTIEEASAKVRCGPPMDKPTDLDAAVWAGELPLSMTAGPAIAAPDLRPELAVPASITG